MTNINQSHSENNTENTSNYDLKGSTFGGSFAGRDYRGNVTHHYADANANETLKEIQSLIKQLSQNSPTNSTSERMKIATQAIETIESNPTWKQKAIAASQQGLLEALKSHPIGAFVAGAIEGWRQG